MNITKTWLAFLVGTVVINLAFGMSGCGDFQEADPLIAQPADTALSVCFIIPQDHAETAKICVAADAVDQAIAIPEDVLVAAQARVTGALVKAESYTFKFIPEYPVSDSIQAESFEKEGTATCEQGFEPVCEVKTALIQEEKLNAAYLWRVELNYIPDNAEVQTTANVGTPLRFRYNRIPALHSGSTCRYKNPTTLPDAENWLMDFIGNCSNPPCAGSAIVPEIVLDPILAAEYAVTNESAPFSSSVEVTCSFGESYRSCLKQSPQAGQHLPEKFFPCDSPDLIPQGYDVSPGDALALSIKIVSKVSYPDFIEDSIETVFTVFPGDLDMQTWPDGLQQCGAIVSPLSMSCGVVEIATVEEYGCHTSVTCNCIGLANPSAQMLEAVCNGYPTPFVVPEPQARLKSCEPNALETLVCTDIPGKSSFQPMMEGMDSLWSGGSNLMNRTYSLQLPTAAIPPASAYQCEIGAWLSANVRILEQASKVTSLPPLFMNLEDDTATVATANKQSINWLDILNVKTSPPLEFGHRCVPVEWFYIEAGNDQKHYLARGIPGDFTSHEFQAPAQLDMTAVDKSYQLLGQRPEVGDRIGATLCCVFSSGTQALQDHCMHIFSDPVCGGETPHVLVAEYPGFTAVLEDTQPSLTIPGHSSGPVKPQATVCAAVSDSDICSSFGEIGYTEELLATVDVSAWEPDVVDGYFQPLEMRIFICSAGKAPLGPSFLCNDGPDSACHPENGWSGSAWANGIETAQSSARHHTIKANFGTITELAGQKGDRYHVCTEVLGTGTSVARSENYVEVVDTLPVLVAGEILVTINEQVTMPCSGQMVVSSDAVVHAAASYADEDNDQFGCTKIPVCKPSDSLSCQLITGFEGTVTFPDNGLKESIQLSYKTQYCEVGKADGCTDGCECETNKCEGGFTGESQFGDCELFVLGKPQVIPVGNVVEKTGLTVADSVICYLPMAGELAVAGHPVVTKWFRNSIAVLQTPWSEVPVPITVLEAAKGDVIACTILVSQPGDGIYAHSPQASGLPVKNSKPAVGTASLSLVETNDKAAWDATCMMVPWSDPDQTDCPEANVAIRRCPVGYEGPLEGCDYLLNGNKDIKLTGCGIGSCVPGEGMCLPEVKFTLSKQTNGLVKGDHLFCQVLPTNSLADDNKQGEVVWSLPKTIPNSIPKKIPVQNILLPMAKEVVMGDDLPVIHIYTDGLVLDDDTATDLFHLSIVLTFRTGSNVIHQWEAIYNLLPFNGYLPAGHWEIGPDDFTMTIGNGDGLEPGVFPTPSCPCPKDAQLVLEVALVDKDGQQGEATVMDIPTSNRWTMDSAGPNLPLQVTTDGLDLILEGSSDPDNQETLVSGIVFRKDNFLGQEISHSVILSSTGTSSAVKEITMTATLFPSKLVICAQSEVCSGPQQICDCAERPFIEAGLAEYLDDSEKWFLLSIRYSLDTGHLSAALSVLTSEEDIFDLPMEFDPLVTPELYFPYISSSLVAMESSVRMGSLGLVFSSLEPDEPTFPATVLDFKSLVYTMNSDWFLANPSVVCPYWKGIGQNPKCFATTQMPSGTVTTNGVWNAGHYIDKCILSDGLDWPCK